MSLFTTMLEKLGLRKKAAADAQQSGKAPPQSQSGAAAGAKPQASPGSTSAPRQQPGAAASKPTASSAASKPVPMAETDVVAKLEAMAAANPQKLNWRTSIVDLMKLLGMDSGLAERKALATELGCPPELMQDSAQMNVWLHKQVLRRIAQNGGNVPAELYD